MKLCRTGIAGLDDVLGGGLPPGRMYLVGGAPGAGKTTLALSFLIEGAEQGERGLYVTLSETEDELREVARSHGWSLEALEILDLQTSEESLRAEAEYTLFHPSDVELSDTTHAITQAVERVRPARIVFDSLSEMRLLARDPLRYRRQLLALKHYLGGLGCTVLLVDTRTRHDGHDYNVETLAHGVISLEQLLPEYGGQRRRLRVQKVRGGRFRDGYHDFKIRRGGLVVFPRLQLDDGAVIAPRSARGPASSGVPGLDELAGGGLDRGTSALLLGPSGAGKSTVAQAYVVAAAARGERAVVFLFDEAPRTWLERGRGLGLPVDEHVAAGRITLTSVNPAQLTPGEFAELVRGEVRAGLDLLVLDSLNGYQKAMPEERFLALHLHELLAFLAGQGVVSLVLMTQLTQPADDTISTREVSYVADAVLRLRFFERGGQARQMLSVVKRRTGDHGRAPRELRLGPDGVSLGPELLELDRVAPGRSELGGVTGVEDAAG